VEIVFDTLGAEQGIDVVLEAGCHLSVQEGIDICFIGDEDRIVSYLDSVGLHSQSNIRVVDTRTRILMDESASDAIPSKQDASICVAMRQQSVSTTSAVITPGHSGATVLAAKEYWGLLPGVSRACLCQILPAENNRHFLLADTGASVNASPSDLCGYAAMTSAAAKTLLGVSQPRIGLLNIGRETGKGDRRLKDTYLLMKKWIPQFTGNIEGHHIWTGINDGVITDGLTGNILMKSAEGIVSLFIQKNRDWFQPAPPADVQTFIRHISAAEYRGAILLGVDGLCIVCHGMASSEDIISAGYLAIRCLQNNFIDCFKHSLIHCPPRTDENP
jgi:phosphate acyltransferase